MPSKTPILVAAAAMLVAAAPVPAPESAPEPAAMGVMKASPTSISAEVRGLDGADLGTVTLTDTADGVLLVARLHGLPAGDHGFHFHAVGVCDPATKFASAGGHFVGTGAMHGLMSGGQPHSGDMPNQHVGTDGTLVTQVLDSNATLRSGPMSLIDADGSALVIHADPDDYTSQPAGNAGARIACAVISAPMTGEKG